MKKIYVTLIAVFAIGQLLFAQSNTYPPTGNVGIGTTSPATKLDILGTTNFGLLQITTSFQVPDIRLRQTNAVHPNTRNWSMYTNLNQYGAFELGVSSARFLDDYSTKFLIDLAGNVGIGTTTPSYRLDIVSNDYQNLRLSANRPLLKFSSPSYNAGDGGEMWQQVDGAFFFNINSGQNAFTINPKGNMGIGTFQPDQKLTVNGTIHSKEIKVDNNIAVPDYVFEKTYKPMNLTELKSYLDSNHHLPEIPSAAEIEKNGLNLGDMNLKLLKKVEELTLYAIEQQKRINELEKEQIINQDQEARIASLERMLMQPNGRHN